MLLIRGPRGLVLIFGVLILVTGYYYYLRLEPTKSLEKEVYASLATSPHSSTPKYKPDVEAGPVSVTSSPELSVSPSDILLIVKTGASTAWRRMPIQLVTTLSNFPNRVIYSDLQENLTPEIQTIDVISNVSDILRTHDTTAYEIYQDLHANIRAYKEQAQLPGDEPELPEGNKPGWFLDRYKFLPMLAHAQKNYPGFKWTVYIEDDTFVFWTNLLRWLATLPVDDEPAYYGSFAGEGNETFAQGGSGVVFSRSLMASVFGGPKIPTLKEYASFTADSCCGDITLGKVLRDHDVLVNRGEGGLMAFRPEPPWKTGFDGFMWCKPIFSSHRLHQKDLVELTMLERQHNQSNLGSRPFLFRDIFLAIIFPYIDDRRSNWDNLASRHILTENITTLTDARWGPPAPFVEDKVALEQAYTSPKACHAACVAVSYCRIWKHEVDNEEQKSCSLDTLVTLGRAIEGRRSWDKRVIESGWMMERIDNTLMADKCEVVVPP